MFNKPCFLVDLSLKRSLVWLLCLTLFCQFGCTMMSPKRAKEPSYTGKFSCGEELPKAPRR